MLSKYSLYKKKLKNGYVWYVKFYNPSTKTYSITRSTGIQCAGKTQKKKQAQIKAQEMLKELDLNKPIYLIDYVQSFWKKNSQYEKLKRLSENKPLSPDYIKLMSNTIIKHVLPYKPLSKILLTDLTAGIIEDWKLWALEKGTGREQLNTTLKALKVPVRYLISRGDLNIIDPFNRVKNVTVTPKEKGILTRPEIQNLLSIKYNDPRIYFAVMLAILAGLRRGELRGLLWKDIDYKQGLINVHNNYIDSEGSKACKCGSDRQVILPEVLIPILKEINFISPYTDNNDFILFSIDNSRKPINKKQTISNFSLRYGFKKLLEQSGISKEDQQKRNLTLHGMRHTFVTMARMAGIPDIAVQAMAGHKSADMMNHYSHGGQVINLAEYKKNLETIQYNIV
jgi:integrase